MLDYTAWRKNRQKKMCWCFVNIGLIPDCSQLGSSWRLYHSLALGMCQAFSCRNSLDMGFGTPWIFIMREAQMMQGVFLSWFGLDRWVHLVDLDQWTPLLNGVSKCWELLSKRISDPFNVYGMNYCWRWNLNTWDQPWVRWWIRMCRTQNSQF